MTQVVIIGGGPTGLTLAMLLVQRGISVKLVEASRNFRRIFRGEALMPSGLAAIEQMGLSEIVEQIPHRSIDAWEFYIENRSVFRVDEPMESGGKPCTLISQPALLKAVLDRAQQFTNFELIQGTAIRDLLRQDDRVSGVRLSDGREILADLVIGADGRNSVVRQQANLEMLQAPQSFDILWFKLPGFQLPIRPDFKAENVFYSILRGPDALGLFQGSEGNLQVGWSLHHDHPMDWQTIDWSEKLAMTVPDALVGLAAHFRDQKESIEGPLKLAIVVGRCPQWHLPGVLLLGDAAHPMSPIRAQGINMALRDVLVAAHHLVPAFQQPNHLAAIDQALAQIQRDREPEIIDIQRLQQAEVAQAELMHNYPFVRHAVSRLAPLIGGRIRASWLDRQLQLRQGRTQV